MSTRTVAVSLAILWVTRSQTAHITLVPGVSLLNVAVSHTLSGNCGTGTELRSQLHASVTGLVCQIEQFPAVRGSGGLQPYASVGSAAAVAGAPPNARPARAPAVIAVASRALGVIPDARRTGHRTSARSA